MDLDVHRAIQLLALQRAATRPGVGDLKAAFHPMWLGNWLTDMNQASAFFDVVDKDHKDPYSVWAGGKYKFSKTIADHPTEWTKMFAALWENEWNTITQWPEFHDLPKSSAVPVGADDIGGYYPYDHFDVVDRIDMAGDALDKWEFESSGKTGMTTTAYNGVFKQCFPRQLNSVFSQPLKERMLPQNLKLLGYATHTLQDFFAHSNFTEVLLQVFSKEGRLDPDLSNALQLERIGTYAAYDENVHPADTRVMTGRFDRIDTVASLLRIYERVLVSRWGDLDAGGYRGRKGETRDLMFEVLFGTFTQEPFRKVGLEAAKEIGQVADFFHSIGNALAEGAITFFASVGKLFASNQVDQQIDDVQNLLLAANAKEATDAAKAGKILYLLHVIEEKLRQSLKNGPKPQLPHHTLLAKDHDEGQPEVRLAFKLACSFAVDVTTDILQQYFSGGKDAEVKTVLDRVYRHPREFLADDDFKTNLNRAARQLYGIRWWLWADEDANGLAPAK